MFRGRATFGATVNQLCAMFMANQHARNLVHPVPVRLAQRSDVFAHAGRTESWGRHLVGAFGGKREIFRRQLKPVRQAGQLLGRTWIQERAVIRKQRMAVQEFPEVTP